MPELGAFLRLRPVVILARDFAGCSLDKILSGSPEANFERFGFQLLL